MRLCVLASGSKGNATLVDADGFRLLVDCGLGIRQLTAALDPLGLKPQDLNAVLLTHEHNDHIRGLETLLKHHDLEVYGTARTLVATQRKAGPLRALALDMAPRWLGPMIVEPVPIPHDATHPVAYRITASGVTAMVATDMGDLSEGVLAAADDADVLVWEANHDWDLLWAGPYPARLKRRITGERGHLSNDQALAGLKQLRRKSTTVYLAHLSETNNRPEMALDTVQSGLGQDHPFRLELTHQHAPSRVWNS